MSQPSTWKWVAVLCCVLASVAQAQDNKTGPKASSLAGAKAFSRAASLQNQQDWDAAIATWREFLRKYPEDALAREAHNYLGVCLLQQESYQSAATEFEKTLKEEQNDEIAEEAHLNLGWCYYSQGFEEKSDSKLRKAAKIFKAHIERYPESLMHDQALYYLAESLTITGHEKKAIGVYQELIRDCPKSDLRADALYALGNAFAETKKPKLSQGAFNLLARDYPQHPMAEQAVLRRAEALVAQNEWQAAHDAFKSLVTGNGENADYALLRLGLCREKLEKFDEAASAYQRLVSKYGRSEFAEDATLGAARASALAHDAKSARKWLAMLDSDDADVGMEAAHWECRLWLMEEQPVKVLRIAETALAEHKTATFRTDVELDLAEARSLIPRHREQAVQDYSRIAKRLPDGEMQWRALLGAADCLVQIKRTDQATAIAESFLKEHEQHEHRPAFAFILAECLRIEGQHDEAGEALNALLENYPQHPLVATWRRRLARVLLQSEQPEEALALLEKMDDRDVGKRELAEAHFFRAIALDTLSRKRDAVLAYRTALETLPDGKWASKCRSAIDDLQNELGEVVTQQQPAESETEVAKRPIEKDEPSKSLELATIEFENGHHERATKILLRATAENRHSPAPQMLAQAYTKLYARQYEDARRLFTQFVDQHQDHPFHQYALYGRALACGYQSEFKSGLSDLRDIPTTVSKKPFAADAVYLTGLYEFNAKDYVASAATLESLLQAHPQFSRRETAMYQLAGAYFENGEMTRGLAWVKRLAKEFPNSTSTTNALCRAAEQAYAAAEFRVAERLFERAVDASVNEASKQASRYKLAWSQYQLAKYATALDNFETITLDQLSKSQALDVQFMQAECLYQLGRLQDALPIYEALNREIAVEPPSRVALLHHGAVCLQTSNAWQTSLRWLDDALRLNPDPKLQGRLRLLAGRAHEALREYDKAHQRYDKAFETNDFEIRAESRLRSGKLLSHQGEDVAAIREFQFVLDESGPNADTWKSLASFAAGRCHLRLAKKAQSRTQGQTHQQMAKQLLNQVVENQSNPQIAAMATKLLRGL